MSKPNKCDICGALATIHLTQIINGNVRKINLCEKCAAKHDVTELPIIKFAEILTKKILTEKIDLNSAIKNKAQKTCPKCGITDLIFEKTQRLGCPKCYETFSKEISEILPKIQGTDKYAGTQTTKRKPANKIPKKEGKEEAQELSLEQLKELLANAVEHEDYKLAAKTRDIIRLREKKSQTRKPRGKNSSPKTTTRERKRKDSNE